MLHFNNIAIFNNINNFEHLVIFFVIPILILLLIMKCAFLITINYHKITINNANLINKTKTIILQFGLWFLAQCCLFFLPIKEIVININLFDLSVLPLLTLISLLHLAICVSFISNKNNQSVKIIRCAIFVVIVIAIILQFNFTMVKVSWPIANSLTSIVMNVIVYYGLMFLSWKMFNDNFLAIFALIHKTWKTITEKSTIPIMIDKQLPLPSYNKIQLIILTWQFEHLSSINNNSKAQQDNKKVLIITYKKNLAYFLSAKMTTSKKTNQDLTTLVNGWLICQIQ